MLSDRFNEQEAQRLALMPGALGFCQYEGEKPEHGYLVITRTPDGVIQALGRRALKQWRIMMEGTKEV